MNSENQPTAKKTTPVKSRSGGWRLLLAVLVGGLILLVGGYFVVTSSVFITGFVLPTAGSAINSKLTADQVALKPLSSLEIKQFELQPDDQEPLVTVERFSVNYDLFKILGGKVVASDIVVEKPVVELVVKEDGSLNVDPIFEALSGPQPVNTEPVNVDLQRCQITNGSLRLRIMGEDLAESVYEIVGLDATLDRLANGATATLTLGGELGIRITSDGETSLLKANLSQTTTKIDFSEELLPVAFDAVLALIVGEVGGLFEEFADNRLDLQARLADYRLSPLNLKISRAGQALGTVEVSGPVNLAEGSADLQFRLNDLNQNLLNQFQDLFGFGFGESELSAEGGLTMVHRGESVVMNAVILGQEFVLQNDQSWSPLLDFGLTLSLGADLTSRAFELRQFEFNATQAAQPLVQAKLGQPLKATLGASGLNVSGAQLDLAVSNLDLKDWNVLLGDAAAGKVNSNLSIAFGGNGGDKITVSGDLKVLDLIGSQVDDLTNGLRLVADFDVSVSELASVDVSKLRLTIGNAEGKLLAADSNLSFGRSGVLALCAALEITNPANRAQAPLGIEIEGRGQVTAVATELCFFALKLPATEKVASNELNLTGRLTTGAAAGLSGDLKLAAKTLDVTPVMDFWDGLTAESEANSKVPTPSEITENQEEPGPIDLPVKRLLASLSFDQVFAREIEVKHWLSELLVEKNRIKLQPLELTLDGAPVKGYTNLDLSVSGFRYAVGLEVTELRSGPLVASVKPSLKTVADGLVSATIDVNGSGVTGANLRQNLAGGMKFSFQGADIELFDFWKKFFLTPVAVVLRIPAMLDSPIQGVVLDSKFEQGNVNLNEFKVLSPHFQVLSSGKIPIADDLMDSVLALPVDLAIAKEMAVAANLVEDDVEAIDGHVKIPPFVKVDGTLAEPKVNIDKVAVGKLFIRNVAGLPESVVGEVGNVLEGLGDMVGGKGSTEKAAGKLLEGIGGLLDGEEKGGRLKEAGNALKGLFNRGKKVEEK
ncbi:MAG: hypothetical protein M2R45_01726 [Verrucomicrobia subdivision 3 bacterium]|nr:hypothetical protein [Limisphaerales bacterium]MCS1413463.1 hypothetical protein [Limisphaerales bacterium]